MRYKQLNHRVFLVTLFRVRIFLSVAYLTVANLAQLGPLFTVRSRLGPIVLPGSSSAGLQVVTQSTYLLKDCYPQLVLNPHCSKI